jgi:putative ABC transport system permease protein
MKKILQPKLKEPLKLQMAWSAKIFKTDSITSNQQPATSKIMNTKKVIQSSFRILFRNKLRTFFMTLGIIIGSLALLLSMSMGEGGKKAMMDTVKKTFGSNSILLASGGGGMMGGGLNKYPLKMEDIEYLEANVDNIRIWDPVVSTNGDVVYEGKNVEVTVYGHSERGAEVWNRDVIKGEYITAEDMEQSARVALVGSRTVERLFEGTDPIGSQIRINNIPFTVKGVLMDEGVDAHGLDRDEDIYVPLTTIQRRVLNADNIAFAQIIAQDSELIPTTVEEITEIMRERHALTAEEENDFSIITSVQVEQMVASMNKTFSVFLPLVALIAIVVGGIVIAVLMLTSIKERRHEIGLRKAVGASSKNIFHQFLLESVTIALVGAAIAIVLAIILITIASGMMPLVVSPLSVVLSIVIPIVVGIIAGVVPARKAAGLDPIENLT